MCGSPVLHGSPYMYNGMHLHIYKHAEKYSLLRDTFNCPFSLLITYSLRPNEPSVFPSCESYIVKTNCVCVYVCVASAY